MRSNSWNWRTVTRKWPLHCAWGLVFVLSCDQAGSSGWADGAVLPDDSATAAQTPLVQRAEGEHPIDPALRLMRQCQQRYAEVAGYEATFIKQERIDGRMQPPEYVQAKFRSRPFSVYLKWIEPEAGKEAIYVEGQNEGKILSRTTGFTGALVGTMHLDPEGSLARKGNRHDIREAGIGNLIEKLLARWQFERRFPETEVTITDVKVNGRPCFLITTVHPHPDDGRFMFHTSKVYVDKSEMLPIRFEGYGFPAAVGRKPGSLVESYTYLDLRINSALTAMDFSPQNPNYRFSRF